MKPKALLAPGSGSPRECLRIPSTRVSLLQDNRPKSRCEVLPPSKRLTSDGTRNPSCRRKIL